MKNFPVKDTYNIIDLIIYLSIYLRIWNVKKKLHN